jgi:hypothetical protein
MVSTVNMLLKVLFTLLYFGIKVSSSVETDFCCLCPNGSYPRNANKSVRGVERMLGETASVATCRDLDAKMFNPSHPRTQPGSANCRALQSKYRNCCCQPNGTCPATIAGPAPAPKAPQNNYPMGNQPKCALCPNFKFPKKPYTITTVQYIPGNPTCQDLHFMGLSQQIPGALCYPLQLYMRVPCGCN